MPAMETWIGEKIFTKQNLVDEILLIDEKFTKTAVQSLHEAYNLEK